MGVAFKFSMLDTSNFRLYAERRNEAVIDFDAPAGHSELAVEFKLILTQAEIMVSQRRHNAKKGILRVNFGILDTLAPNGFAQRWNGQHYCSVTFGFYLNVLGISIWLMRHTDWMSDIGSPPTSPALDAMTIAPGNPFLLRIRDSAGRLIQHHDTDDYERMSVALMLRYELTRLVLAHEYFHAALGHCDIVKDSLGLSGALCEYGTIQPEVIENPHTLRWFEYLADQAAFQWVLDRINTNTDVLSSFGGIFADIALRNRVAIVAAGVLGSMWHAYNRRLSNPDIFHPAPTQRVVLLIRVAIDKLKEYESEQKVSNIIDYAADDLVRMGRICSGLDLALSETQKTAHGGAFEDNAGIQELLPAMLTLYDDFTYIPS